MKKNCEKIYVEVVYETDDYDCMDVDGGYK